MELFPNSALFCDRLVLVNTSYFVILIKLYVDMCTFIILYVTLLYMHVAVPAGIYLNTKCY